MSLIIKDLFYTYPKTKIPVINSLSAKFEEGTISAVTGANGCGKTTFVKNIVGILKPDSGEILIDGVNLAGQSIAQIAKKIGCVFQNPSSQIFCLSVADEVAYGLKNQGLLKEQIDYRVDYYLEYFELYKHKNDFPFDLSQGEKQRLVLAAVLAMQPKYIILDEPTTGLDRYRSQLLGKYLQKISNDGCGIIFVSHDTAFVKRYAQNHYKMENGIFGVV